ncbi:transcriptional regulator [Mergibacter septicus]|uniref:Transcriptional regulator n=1 Tax=Mergibacter septicus TaxID=221402 RepID=A0A8E3MD59_9PAST|nr:YdaS family helix-turn-helix protein [Mergibacter septicus]AWX15583.1 transcriptional regulator [Mergibacter septicus]QDJ13059.1 transcriptional regulator [Mergibacter septicus]QDJ14837.1 transcriptional regulator [Mergibacter septicus]UTU47735.1 helix-turn-helix domain-containing protein [Mergibacter septicus]WMR96659.1 YdaS family helix-turn-helix protein [Mergibacter septicus]
MKESISKAIKICGSQTALANYCGVSQQTVCKWLNGGGIRAKYIQRIVNATNGKITADELLSELNKSDLQN